MPRYVASKWKKTLALVKDRAISAYIPRTVRMTQTSLEAMLNRYGMVYVKPSGGKFGNGVMKVENIPGAAKPFGYQHGLVKRSFEGYNEFYRSLSADTKGTFYLVQQGVPLLKHRGRPFDLRVMVQVSPQGRWETTGIIGRVAHPRKIVTNFHNGGKLRPLKSLLKPYADKKRIGEAVRLLRRLGLRVAKQMGKKFPGVKEIGLDVGMDDALKPWILEVNTCPDPFIFRKLAKKRIFRRVYRYAKAYGRFK